MRKPSTGAPLRCPCADSDVTELQPRTGLIAGVSVPAIGIAEPRRDRAVLPAGEAHDAPPPHPSLAKVEYGGLTL